VEARFRRADISWRVEDRVLTQLRSMVSPQMPHEFFTPITGILGLLEVMRTNFAGAIPAEVQDIHGEIFQSVLRLQRTLRNYLLLLDLEDVHPVTLTEALSWRQVEESIVAGVKAVLQLNKRQEDIMVQVNECSVAVKPEDLVRIVEELVDNACKFSRQGTPITVEMESDGRLTVTDKGRGMTAEEVRSIGAFQQFDRKQHEQEGLGLGLVLVQKLAVKCHAKFLLSSDPGEGTRAQVTFLLYAQEYS
jgi:signal transduction histidine kinase